MFIGIKPTQIRATLRKELVIMKYTLKSVGLDVSKGKIADEGQLHLCLTFKGLPSSEFSLFFSLLLKFFSIIKLMLRQQVMTVCLVSTYNL
jgi:hypothetical protein